MSIVERSRRLRADARSTVRAGRRLAVGARDLSLGAATGWVADRARRRPPIHENSSFSWVVADEGRTTLCWLHNYWSDAYGIDRPAFTASLVDVGGATVAEWDIVLEPDATAVIDVRAESRRAGVALPFEGQLLLCLDDPRVVPGRPVQAFVEYVRDDGEVSGVHGQYGLMRSPLAQYVGGCRVDPTPGSRSGIVVVNPYDGPSAPVAMRSVLELLTADGAIHRATLPALAPRASARVYLDEALPGLDRALAGRAGQVRVRVPCPSSRALTFVERPDGGLVVNHATIDRSFDQGSGVPPHWTGSAPALSLPVFAGGGSDTVLTLPNCWGPEVRSRVVQVTVYAADGTEVSSTRVDVAARATVELSLADLAGHALTTGIGHAEVVLVDDEVASERPAVLDVVLGIRRAGRLVAECQVGSDFFNAPVAPGARMPDIRRTRVFTRVRLGTEPTVLFVANPVAPGGTEEVAHPLLTLLDTSGRSLVAREVEIAPRGFVCGRVDELFGPQHVDRAAVRVRDTARRLYGYHLGAGDGSAPVPFDHLVGG